MKKFVLMFCDVLKLEFIKCYRFLEKLSNSNFRTSLILLGFLIFLLLLLYISFKK